MKHVIKHQQNSWHANKNGVGFDAQNKSESEIIGP